MTETRIETFKGFLTEEDALDSDLDMIPTLQKVEDTFKFKHELELRRSEIEKLIRRHLGIPYTDFELSQSSDWIRGGFNMCLPIYINNTHNSRLPRQALIRFPVPSGVGESFSPGVSDEKLRCEAATYVWLRSNCPTIPIPRLLGIGFPGTQSFTAIENESLWNRVTWQFRRSFAWLNGDKLSPYFAHRRDDLVDHGYLLIEYVMEGRMLSSSFQEYRHDERRRANLYHGLAKIMLSLAHIPLPRIGSWTMNDRGVISLTNRPLSDLTLVWSRHHIPTNIPRNLTYSTAEPFIHDMISYQDNRLRHQPNSIHNENDGIIQLSLLAAMRTLLPRFWDQHLRSGPFVLTLPDLHQSNIFVDDQWNITSLIDFEFAPVRPIQMSHVPYWLTNQGVDELDGARLVEYKALYDKFVSVIEEEEIAGHHANTYSRQLLEDWNTGRFWYSMALNCINAFPAIFEQHFHPSLFDMCKMENNGVAFAQLWDENVLDFIDSKLEDESRYVERIHDMFAAARARKCDDHKGVEVDGEGEIEASKDDGVAKS